MNAQLNRRIATVVVTAGFALALVPVGRADIKDGRSPDTVDAAVAAQTQIVDGRSPDTLDAAQAAQSQIADGRSPDTRDAAAAAHSVPSVSVDLRSPDTKDAAQLAHSPGTTIVVQSGSGSFDWTDAGIGAAGGFAIALIMGGLLTLSRVGSKRRLAL